MLENLKSDVFEYQKLTPEEQQKRGILGRLVGVIADFKKPTRNGRFYSEEAWEKAFNDPLVIEKLQTKTLLGELNHPADRLETDPEKVCICLSDKPKKGKDGKLYGVFDILDTPNGRILKTLCDYGCSIGVSSRANGETSTDWDGKESVDPNSFTLEAWDAVLLPAVKEARMSYVTESLDTKKTLKQALNEALEKANVNEKKVMTETLNNLNIDITNESKDENLDNKSEIAANNDGATMVKDLQEALLAKQKLESQIIELQEKLSVCYAKEAKDGEEIDRYRQAIRNLSESASNARALQKKVDLLNEELKQKDAQILEEQNKTSRILSKQEIGINRQNQLNEALSKKSNEIRLMESKMVQLNETIESIKKQSLDRENKLQESISSLKKDLTIKTTEYSTKLANANKLIEQYRTTAKSAVNKYIDSQAVKLGLNSDEVKSKLPRNYSFADIDSICESLSQFKLKINNLPVSVQSNINVKVKESKEPILPKTYVDDDIDNSLLQLANFKK